MPTEARVMYYVNIQMPGMLYVDGKMQACIVSMSGEWCVTHYTTVLQCPCTFYEYAILIVNTPRSHQCPCTHQSISNSTQAC